MLSINGINKLDVLSTAGELSLRINITTSGKATGWGVCGV